MFEISVRGLPLTPCFSWVKTGWADVPTVSTVWTSDDKPLKRLPLPGRLHTRLKPGVNVIRSGRHQRAWDLRMKRTRVDRMVVINLIISLSNSWLAESSTRVSAGEHRRRTHSARRLDKPADDPR